MSEAARGRAGCRPSSSALRPLPGLHGVRDRLPVRGAVRQADRGHARAGRAQPPTGRPASASSAACCSQLFPHPARLRALAPLLAARAPAGHLARGPARRSPATAARARRAGAARRRCARRCARLPELTPARGRAARPRRPAPGLRPARVLRRRQRGDRRGAAPPRASRCTRRSCRAAAARSSCTPASTPSELRWQARRSRRSSSFDHVVVNAAGCGSAMKDYAHVLRDDPEWAERARALLREGARRHRAAGRARAARRASPGPPTRSPTTTPATSRTRRACARSRASCCADPRARAGRARRLGDLLRLGRRLQPAGARGGGRARAPQGREPAAPPAPRRSPPPTPAARSRSPPRATRWDGRCASTTRSSCCTCRSREAVDGGRTRAVEGRIGRGADRRRARVRGGAAAQIRATRARAAAPARRAQAELEAGADARLPRRDGGGPRGRLERSPTAARPAGPARRDHRPDRRARW